VRLDDPHAPLQVLAQERISIGRTADNELQIEEDWMSRRHATLRLGADATIVEDCGSTNGVFVNGRRIRRELLHDGDEIAFGKARFRFQVHRPGGSRD
jgi:pSer/pThr/pTyr-binding forkhead associated (FHA) protein